MKNLGGYEKIYPLQQDHPHFYSISS